MTHSGDHDELKDPRAIGLFVDALKDQENDSVREVAAQALHWTTSEIAGDALIKTLKEDKSPIVCRTAARSLWNKTNPGVVEALIAALKDKELSEAARTLGLIKTPRAVEPLIGALTPGLGDVSLGISAAIALEEIGDLRGIIAAKKWRKEEARRRARAPLPEPVTYPKSGGICTCKNSVTGYVYWSQPVNSDAECKKLCPGSAP
jgi:HEAT repeat protein